MSKFAKIFNVGDGCQTLVYLTTEGDDGKAAVCVITSVGGATYQATATYSDGEGADRAFAAFKQKKASAFHAEALTVIGRGA